MSVRPLALPEWATSLVEVLEPNPGQKTLGWVYQESPEHNNINWLFNTNYQWHDYITEHIDQFAVIQQAIADNTIQVTAGLDRNGLVITNVAAQNTGAFTFPTVNPRIDRIVLDSANAVQVITGAEAASPVAPAITSDVTTLAQVALAVGQTVIIQANITPERTNPYKNGGTGGALLATSALSSYQLINGLALEYDIASNEGMITASGVGAVNRAIELRALSSGVPNANQIFLAANGFVGFGTNSPDGLAHFHSGTAGSVTANANADELVVENSGATGITILAPDSFNSSLYFGSPTDSVGAKVDWNHDALLMQVGTGKVGGQLAFLSATGTEAMRITASQNVGIGIATPDGRLHVHTGTAGVVTASANADDLVVENSTHCGISIFTPNTNTGSIYFGSPADNLGALINYGQSTALMQVGTHLAGGQLALLSATGIETMRLYADQGVTVGAPTAASLGAGTVNIENQLGIGVSVDTGAPLTIESASAINTIIKSTSVGGSPQLYFYQTTTARAYVQLHDSNKDLRVASRYGRVSFWNASAGAETIKAYFDPDGGFVVGAPTAASLGAGTVNIENQLGIGTSVDSGIAFHIENAAAEKVRLQSTSTTGITRIGFYQTTVRRAYIQHQDTNDSLDLVSPYGRISFLNDSAGTETLKAYIDPDGGFVVGAPTGASKGAGTGNFQNGVYANGIKIHGGEALVTRTTSQSIPNNSATVIAFPSEVTDTDAIHDNVTNNSRLTVPTGVTKVRVYGQIQWAAHATGYRHIHINKNAALFAGLPNTSINAVTTASVVTITNVSSGTLTVVAGDYFELIGQQTSGGNLNAEGFGAGNATWFAMDIIE